ncbi:hypothetical protein Esti_001009 [Eimeria stiedai]
MSSVKADKRNDDASASLSRSPRRKHRTGRDAAAWEDAELFEDADDLPHGEEAGDGRFNEEGQEGKQGKRRLSNSSASSTAADAAAAQDPAAAAESSRPRAQRRQRQPPLHASAFLLNADGSPKDGLLSLYCNLNYSLDKLHKFKFLDTLNSREQRRDEHTRELQAAHALLAMHSRKREQKESERLPPQEEGAGGVDPSPRVYGQQEAVRAAVTVKHRKRQLARLAAEERLYLREDLNTLLGEIREGLLACYPYNEHLSRLSRRLDKISTQPDMWAKYRPRLVQLHKSNFLHKWEEAGCPLQPHKLLHAEGPSAGLEADANRRPEEAPADAADPSDAVWGEPEASLHAADPWDRQQSGSQTNAADKSTSTEPQDYRQNGEEIQGPSAEQLEELRQKQLEARARREKLRAARLQQQQQQQQQQQ